MHKIRNLRGLRFDGKTRPGFCGHLRNVGRRRRVLGSKEQHGLDSSKAGLLSDVHEGRHVFRHL